MSTENKNAEMVVREKLGWKTNLFHAEIKPSSEALLSLALSQQERIEKLEKYAAHLHSCAHRPHRCQCCHSDNQHFMNQERQPCAHCNCSGFFPEPCTCGLAALLEEQPSTRKEQA